MKIESTDLSVEDMLNGNYFVIPRFQRPYSWEEDNITDFWNDVTGDDVSDYFIGSMVVYKIHKNTLGVVDGQQRLTTIIIFLCGLRDAFTEIGEIDKAEGCQGFIERKDRENKGRYVLKTETSFPFFQEKILKHGKAELETSPGKEEEALAKASNIFSDNINTKLRLIDDDPTINSSNRQQRKISWLTKTRDVILELNIILITLDNEDDAYLIFETLNTRGKDLELSDLVKNLFTRILKATGDVDLAKLKWEKVLETILNSSADLSPDNFIVHSWQSRFDAVTKAKAFPKIKATITTEATAIKHLDDFNFDAECYRSIFEPNYGWRKDNYSVKNSLEALNLFKVVQPTPALLSLVRAYKKNQIRFGTLKKTLLAIENFHFSFTAVTSSRSSGGISSMYSSFGRNLFKASNSDVASAEIRSLIGKLKERVPVPNEFDAAFEQIIYTKSSTSHRALVRYILSKLFKHENLPYVGTEEELTIEHLISQEKIGNGNWTAEIVGQIGNLYLVDTDTNTRLGTKSFKEKKRILLENGYQIPEEFSDIDELTPELISGRTLNVAKSARETIWKIT